MIDEKDLTSSAKAGFVLSETPLIIRRSPGVILSISCDRFLQAIKLISSVSSPIRSSDRPIFSPLLEVTSLWVACEIATAFKKNLLFSLTVDFISDNF